MAKIPTILEAGRADGILIKTDNVYDDNKKKFLSDKLEEIDNNHNALNNTIKSLSNTVNNKPLLTSSISSVKYSYIVLLLSSYV